MELSCIKYTIVMLVLVLYSSPWEMLEDSKPWKTTWPAIPTGFNQPAGSGSVTDKAEIKIRLRAIGLYSQQLRREVGVNDIIRPFDSGVPFIVEELLCQILLILKQNSSVSSSFH